MNPYKDKLHLMRRKKLFFKITLFFFSIVVLLSLLVYLLFFAGFFNVKEVAVKGDNDDNNELIKEEIEDRISKKIFFIPLKFNILFVNSKSLESYLKNSLAFIESVNISKKLPHTINVDIVQRKTIGIWCLQKTNSCFYFDSSGVAFEKSPASEGIVLLNVNDFRDRDFGLLEKVESDEWFLKIIQSKESLRSLLGLDIREVIIPEDTFDEFHVVTSDGWKLMLTNGLDIKFQMESLQIFISQHLTPVRLKNLTYIDARIVNRFYFK